MKTKICHNPYFTLIDLEEDLHEMMERAKLKMLINRIRKQCRGFEWIDSSMDAEMQRCLNAKMQKHLKA